MKYGRSIPYRAADIKIFYHAVIFLSTHFKSFCEARPHFFCFCKPAELKSHADERRGLPMVGSWILKKPIWLMIVKTEP
jgi:hypothetical protein